MVAIAAALLALLGAGCSDGPIEPADCSVPIVSRSEVGRHSNNVLSAFVTASVQNADSVEVRFGGVESAMSDATPRQPAGDEPARLLLLGLFPAKLYHAQVVASNQCGSTTGDLLTFKTDALPSDLPSYSASGSNPSPGYVAFAAGSYGLVIDNTGRVVWYHRFPNGPGLNFQPQPNGRYVARPTAALGETAVFTEIDPAGTVTRTLGCAGGLQPRMHDMIAQPDGSYWLLCDETRTVDLSAQGSSVTARVLGTSVQRRSATGDLIFSWSPFDHFDIDLGALESGDLTGASINWTHGNALDLDGNGDLLVSFRNLSEVTKIDTRTGAVLWRLGGARNQFTFDNAGARPFSRQHGLRANGAGKIVLLDNLGDPGQSRAEAYELDEARRSARLARAAASPARLIALLGGTTQPLPGGRTLVSYGNGGGVEEYDAQGNVVWRLTGNPGYVFRALRIRSLYQPGVGDPR